MTDRYSTPYGVFHISPKPGLPQIAICHGFYVLSDQKGKGNGHQLMQDMLHSLQLENYDLAICSTADNNIAMQAVLKKANWTMKELFHNAKTGEFHQLWTIHV